MTHAAENSEVRRQPMWLVRMLEGIVERGERVCPEMAAHRSEVKPTASSEQEKANG